MSRGETQVDAHPPVEIGPAIQRALNITDLVLPSSIPGGNQINSNLIYTNGYKRFSFAATSTQAGTISIQPYLDVGGKIVQGPAITASFISSTPIVINANPDYPFQTIQINISNTSSSGCQLSNVLLLFQSY